MALKRNVSLATALRYKGQGPMLTYFLHRFSGLGMAIFITIHILASFVGGKSGVFINSIYENWLFQIFIFFCVMFHAINGMRITIQDLWPKAIKYEREAIWVEWVIFLPLYLISVLVILRTAMGV